MIAESRGIDEPARYGGEEFVLALPETPKAGAVEVAERVRERIAATRIDGVEGGGAISVTASIGVATMPDDGNDTRGLIAAADAALYEAKRAGKNRVIAANGASGSLSGDGAGADQARKSAGESRCMANWRHGVLLTRDARHL